MKNKFSISKLSVLFLSAVVLFSSCSKDKDDNPAPDPVNPVAPKMTIEFDHLAGNKKFHYDSTYTTANGDQITPKLFKYYVSNIRLVGVNNAEYSVPDSYFLINHDEDASRIITLTNLPEGKFKAVKFILGVDSARNVSGAQTGALDPVNGMFWTWNSGYIFLKLEGTSPSVPSASNDFSFHIGGFKLPNINFKEIELDFDGDELVLAKNGSPELHIVADVLEIFTNPNTINLATFGPTVHMPNANAGILSQNYVNLFRYDHIHE